MNTPVKKASLKELFGWCMFDFANSSYTTVIITVVFGDIFSTILVPSSGDPENPYKYGNMLWAVALAISYILVVVSGPFFGAVMDYSARKKQFLFYSYLLCILSTALLFFAGNTGEYWLAFFLIIVSNFAFASGENFAASFLPFLGPKDELGKISGMAWAVGYFGGLASVAIVQSLGDVKPENILQLRWVGPYTAVFFLIAGVPTFSFLKEYSDGQTLPAGRSYSGIAIDRVVTTLRDVTKFKDLMLYLTSLFFAMASLGIVISFAFIYGKQEVHIDDKIHKPVMFIVLQFTAAAGAYLFGVIQDRIGALKTFNLTVYFWIVSVIVILQVAPITGFLNSMFGTNFSVQWMFVVVTSLAGLGLGATQSSSRAIVAIFAPESKVGEFFGLWGFSGKLAAAFGLLLLALLQSFMSFRGSFAIIAVFFAVSVLINRFVDEERGAKAASDYKE